MDTEVRYLVVGAGLTADAACRGIREVDPDGLLAVVGEEGFPPYLRPPLSKALWRGEPESGIWCGTEALGVELRLGRRIVAVDLDRHVARDDAGDGYAYERLLFATGGRPRRLPSEEGEVVYFRTLADYRRLRVLVDEGARFVVVGGGFIGSEIAAALAMNGREVTLVFPGVGIGARLFPEALSRSLNDYYRARGVEVVQGASVTGIERGGATARVTLGDGRVLEADAVVAGLGIEPNDRLAAAAGLEVSDGIVVDSFGRAGERGDVYAAGDVARFPAAALARDLRVEHEDHARSHGRRVGANMAGADEPYDHLPFFYSDLFDVGYEAVGEVDSSLDVRVYLGDVHDQGVVYYLDRERRARGVLLWNLFGRVEDARELIRAATPVTGDALGAGEA